MTHMLTAWNRNGGVEIAAIGGMMGTLYGFMRSADYCTGESEMRALQITLRRTLAGALTGAAIGYTLPVSVPFLLLAPLSRGRAVCTAVANR